MTALRYVEDLFSALGVPAPLDFARGERCVRAARRMPLTHGLKCGAQRTAFLAANEAALLSRKQRNVAPSPAQRFAGTTDAVCFWVGPLRIPEREAALVFSADIELHGTTATPWDSGGLRGHAAQHMDETQRKRLIQLRSMPSPDYRSQALAASIFIRHGTPDRYLRADIICDVDPDKVSNPRDPSTFTYEARVLRRVRVRTKSLLYVAARRDAVDPGLHELRTWCREEHVDFALVGDRDPHRTVVDAILGYFMSIGL